MAKAAEPSYPACGHSACGEDCKVRYVGPVSHVRDHHILHAARGMTHVWPAAIVAGLAVVLTGTLAFTAAQARTEAQIDAASKSLRAGLGRDVNEMVLQIEELKKQLTEMSASCTRSGR